MLSSSAAEAHLYSGSVRALAVLLALVAAAAVACGGEQGMETSPSAAPPAETESTTGGDTSRPQAPPVEGTTLDDEALSLADFRGTPVLVNVWSSW
jgi:hypothetical protein